MSKQRAMHAGASTRVARNAMGAARKNDHTPTPPSNRAVTREQVARAAERVANVNDAVLRRLANR